MDLNNVNFDNYKYQLNIQIISDNIEIKNYYNNFKNHHLGDSGIDLIFKNYLEINPFEIGTLNFEIRCEMINLETNTYSSYNLVPRSSISNTYFQMANSIGIIDAGYRGNIMAKIRNFNPNNSEIVPNDKSIFQIVSPDLKPIKVVIVEDLSYSTRNKGSFGSTN